MRKPVDKVENIRSPQVVTTDIGEEVDTALDKMKRRGVRAIVVTEDEKPRYVLSMLKAIQKTKKGNALSLMIENMEEVKTVRSGTLVTDVYDDLQKHRLLVVNDKTNNMVGVISASDLIK